MNIVRILKDSGRKVGSVVVLAAFAAGVAGPSRAADVFVGGYDHGLFTKSGQESGADIMAVYRTDQIGALWWLGKPSVDVMVSANTQVSTDFVAVGFNWPIKLALNGRLYVRPAFGLAYTNGEANVGNSYAPGLSDAERERRAHLAATRIDFGSPEQFKEELAFGYKLTPKLAVEASYIHLSNGQILHQGKNQGLDDAGLRVAYSF